MIQTIIDALDLAASAQLPTVARSGLAELKPSGAGTAPFIYAGGSDWTQLATDASGTYSYWRLTSPVVEVDTDGPSCNDYFQATYQLRLVSFVDREMCGALPDAARSAASAIRGADVDVAAALALSPRSGVTRVQVDLDSAKIFQQEFGTSGDVPPGKSLVAIDVTLVAIGKASCFAPCQEPESLLCMTIGIATWNAIKACMSQAQIDAAEADLCAGGGPCDPLTVTVNDTEFTSEADPCGATVNVPVVDGTLTAVGSKVGDNWQVPTAKSLCELVTEGTASEVSVCVISSGKRPAVLADLIPTVDEADTVAQVFDVMTPGQQDLFDVTIQLKDTGGTNIGSPDVYTAGTSTNKTAPDGTIRTTDGLTDVDVVKSNGATNLPKSEIEILDATGAQNFLAESNTKYNGSFLQPALIVPRITIYESDGVTVQGYAGVDSPFYTVDACPVCPTPSGIAYNFGRILHSGQETVYQAGDEGTMFDDGFFDYTRPTYPTHYAELGADFTTLAANNVWGNTLRFTDRAGAAAASSGNRFIQDHLTGLEYYALGTYLVAASWNAAVTEGVNINATLGETGWYLPNDRVLDSITNDNSASFLSSAPFSAPVTGNMWTSSTQPGNTASAKFLGLSGGQLGAQAKTSNITLYGIFVRRLP